MFFVTFKTKINEYAGLNLKHFVERSLGTVQANNGAIPNVGELITVYRDTELTLNMKVVSKVWDYSLKTITITLDIEDYS